MKFYKTIYYVVCYISLVIIGILGWYYLINNTPTGESYKKRAISIYCKIKSNSEYCLKREKRKKDSLEAKNYCAKLFPVTHEDFFPKDQENINYEAIENNQKCTCKYMKEKNYNKDDDCRTFSEFLQDPLKVK